MLFIWSRSLFDGVESSAQSSLVVGVLAPAFGAAGISDVDVMTLAVRKAAHFLEYLVLGLLLSLSREGGRGRVPWQQLFVGLAVPVADESIQALVPGRSSLVTDVLIDFAGVSAGLALGNAIGRITTRPRRR